MNLEHTFIGAATVDAAENLGIIKKAGEASVVPPLPASLEEVLLRGLLGMDIGEPLTEAHLEQARIMYGIELPKTEPQPE